MEWLESEVTRPPKVLLCLGGGKLGGVARFQFSIMTDKPCGEAGTNWVLRYGGLGEVVEFEAVGKGYSVLPGSLFRSMGDTPSASIKQASDLPGVPG